MIRTECQSTPVRPDEVIDVDAEQRLDLTHVAGLLGQLAQRADLRVLAEVETATGQGPLRSVRPDPAGEQQPSALVMAQRVRGDAELAVGRHGRRRYPCELPSGSGPGAPRAFTDIRAR